MKKQSFNPTRLPYGAGSLHFRGQSWWMIQRIEDRVVQLSAQTDDLAEARRKLAQRAVKDFKLRLKQLEAIANGAEDALVATALGSGRKTGSADPRKRSFPGKRRSVDPVGDPAPVGYRGRRGAAR